MIDENAQASAEKDLAKLGLVPKEASIYMALLQLGLVGSSKIITATGLHGQFVYQSLATLEEKGLVQHVIQNGRKKFSARPPAALLSIAEDQRRTAEAVAAQLEMLVGTPAPQQFQIFQGADSYIAHEFELLEKAPHGATLLIIGGLGDKFHQTMGDRVRAYDVLRTKKKIRVRYIGSEAQRDELQRAGIRRGDFDFRLLPGDFAGEVNTNVWPDAVSFNVYGTPIGKITITNTAIAASYRQFFETLWRMGK